MHYAKGLCIEATYNDSSQFFLLRCSSPLFFYPHSWSIHAITNSPVAECDRESTDFPKSVLVLFANQIHHLLSTFEANQFNTSVHVSICGLLHDPLMNSLFRSQEWHGSSPLSTSLDHPSQ